MTPTAHFIILVLIAAIIIFNTNNAHTLKFPSILVFGDSTVDTGNNNYLNVASLVRANHVPYGRDFPGHVATGRFSNGKLVPDFIASMLNIKDLVPPFLNPNLSDHELLTGVNFASAGSGFDNLTFCLFDILPMLKQVDSFRSYASRLRKIAGEEEAEKMLQEALVLASAGANDFIYNFYDTPIRSAEYKLNVSRYQDFILSRLQIFVQELYQLGLRKIAVVGLPPVGCLPLQMALKRLIHGGCVGNENSDTQLYNQKLENLLPQIEQLHPGSRLLYTDIYNLTLDFINNPQKYGFEITNKGCCGKRGFALAPFCNILTTTCDDASKYVFWDSVHPTEVAYRYISKYVVQNVLPRFLVIEL